MNPRRRYIARPKTAKQCRWLIALHEAAHAVAYAAVAGVSSVATLAHRSGECAPRKLVMDLHDDALCVAAGPAGESIACLGGVPARRPGRTYPRRKTPLVSDQKRLAKFTRHSELEQRVAAADGRAVPSFDLTSIATEARALVWQHAPEILAIARRLYHRGRAYVHASSLSSVH